MIRCKSQHFGGYLFQNQRGFMNKKYFYLFLVLAFLTASNAIASFSSPVINLKAGSNIMADGQFLASKKLMLTAGEEVGGNGYMESPEIEITTKKFTFTGIIKCDGKCTIKTQVPVDQKKFKREGKGEFVFTVVAPEPEKPAEPFAQDLEQAIKYRDGKGVETDIKKAIEYFTAAAEKGSPFALTQLGIYYIDGEGVPQDSNKGIALLTKAAEKGQAYALYYIGVAYHKGLGVPKDNARAFEFLLKAAEMDEPNSICAIAQFYFYGIGTAQDFTEALKWGRKSDFSRMSFDDARLLDDIARKAEEKLKQNQTQEVAQQQIPPSSRSNQEIKQSPAVEPKITEKIKQFCLDHDEALRWGAAGTIVLAYFMVMTHR